MRLSNTIYYLLSTLIITTLFTGCSAEEELLNGKEENKQEKVEAAIILSVNAPKANTRAGETTGLPGTSAENKINNLAIFIVGDNKVDTYQIECSESESGETSSYVLNIETLEGSKKIYVGANMSQEQINAIKKQSSIEKAQAQLSKIEEVTGSTNGYLMTGQATDKQGNSTIQIEANKFTMVTVALHRVVSKVLVTCAEYQKGYVTLTAGCKGYIRRENVKYALETTNRKFYYFAQPYNEDPNYSLKSDDLAGNFWSYKGDVKKDGETAIKMDANRLNSSSENPYYEGLYCLENTFTIDDAKADAQKVVTYLKIAAKFTPSSIDGNENLTETKAINKLSKSGGTFYTYKKAQDALKHMCYSSIAIARTYLNSKGYTNIKDTDFTAYEGGWQEYVSFVNSPVFSNGAQLKRNNYYIANIKGFTAPVVDKTIEVNTVITEWVTKGTTTVEIETGK